MIAAVVLLLFATSFAAYPSWTKVDFSVKRGFYDKPFSLAFTQPFVGSSIRYVIIKNGDAPIEPSATVGTLYTSGSTFQITQTCTVKAFGWTTSQKTNVTHHSYIFVADLAKQPTLLTSVTQNPKFSPSLNAGFKSFPTMVVSSVTRYPDWADKSVPYFKVFMEWIDPDEPSGKNDWHASSGVEIYGGYSVNYQKKNLRFHFQDTFGTDGLEQTVFDGFDWGVGSAKKFKSLNFRSHSQDGIFGDVWDWKPITWMKNIWHDWFFQDLGHVAPHARYAHIIWNGRYEGIYHVRERMGSHFFKEYLGGEREDYCGISKGRVFDGNIAQCPWATIRANPRYAQVVNYLDWNSYLDYVIVTHYGGNADLAYEHNWQAGGPVLPAPYLGKDAGFKFFLSDQDATFWYGDIWRDITGGDFLSSTWQGLIGEKHPDFMMKFQDRIWRLLVSPRGQLLPGAVRARFDRIINKFRMNVSIVVETARWGQYSKGGAANPFNLDNWRSHLNDLFSFYIPIRTGTTINQYYARGWMNQLGGPSFNLEDGLLYENKTKLQMTYLEGSQIYYTLDATDPRTAGGGTNPKALKCLAPCEWKMHTTQTIWARVNQGGIWGPIEKMTFRSDPLYCYHCGKVVITEIMYHSVIKRAEWIEVKNIHNEPVNMNQVYFQGLRYTFPPVVLQPGQFWIIADTWEGFKKVYGRYPDDHSWLTLDDDESTLVMRDPAGRRIQTVEYSDSRPWSELPDGYGYSLVARNYKDVAEDDPPTSPKNWRASSDKNGSPWKDDPPTKLPKINMVLNEVMANNGGNEWIELLNNGTTSVDLFGWSIQDGYRDGEEYTFPKGTTLGAGASLSFNEAKLGFQLNKLGGKIVIFQAQCCRDDGSGKALNTGEYVEFSYEHGLPGISTGWYKASNGQLRWGRLAASSAGSTANGAPWISNVLIAGIVANIPWDNVPYRALEYVRITNNGPLAQDLTKWQVRVARETLPLSGTLAPKQNLYVIFTTDVTHFKKTWGFDRRDPTARYVTQIKNYTNLNHWIYIDAWIPSLNSLALVDSVSGSWLADIVKMKRDVEVVKPSDVPKEYLRNLNSKFDPQDPQSWGFQQYLPAPFDCVWNLWTEWSGCSTTCAAGTQSRSRTKQQELYGGNACVGDAAQQRACIPGNQPCPIDCTWTEWSEWTTCPVTCMGGVQMTNRTMTPAKWGGLVCTGPSWQFRTCNENPCPIDCVLSQWTEWSECSAKCGEGTKTRSREVEVVNQFDGLCLEALEDSATCQIVTCYPAWAIALIVLAGVIGILLLLALLAACIGGGSASGPGEVGSGYQAM